VAERSGFLKEIHSHLELNDHYAIGLDLSTMARRLSGTVSIYDYLKRRKKEAEDGKMLQKLDFISKMEEFAHSNKGREYADRLSLSLEQRKVRPKPKSSAAEFPFSIFVDTLNGGLDTSIGGSTDALRWAMEIGYLRPGRLTFKRKNGQEINQDELSAGQWSLFSVMTSLALSIQDDSLILIDEPESGLHPAWQRTFLDMFMKAISHAKRCHALIATHSPLLLSSLDPKTADLVSLTRDPATDLLVAELGALPLGWDTSLILQDMFDLEDARAPKLTKLVDKALGLIARGIQGNEQQLQTLITQIQPYYESLPEEDVGKGIISSIIKAVSAKK
jgi:hypothetical protein